MKYASYVNHKAEIPHYHFRTKKPQHNWTQIEVNVVIIYIIRRIIPSAHDKQLSIVYPRLVAGLRPCQSLACNSLAYTVKVNARLLDASLNSKHLLMVLLFRINRRRIAIIILRFRYGDFTPFIFRVSGIQSSRARADHSKIVALLKSTDINTGQQSQYELSYIL